MEVLRKSSVFAAEVLDVFDRSLTEKELVSQSKALCRDYILSRLTQNGLGWSKMELNFSPLSAALAEVSMVLLCLGKNSSPWEAAPITVILLLTSEPGCADAGDHSYYDWLFDVGSFVLMMSRGFVIIAASVLKMKFDLPVLRKAWIFNRIQIHIKKWDQINKSGFEFLGNFWGFSFPPLLTNKWHYISCLLFMSNRGRYIFISWWLFVWSIKG